MIQVGDQDEPRDAGLGASDEIPDSGRFVPSRPRVSPVARSSDAATNVRSGAVGDLAIAPPPAHNGSEQLGRRRPKVSLVLPAYNEEARLSGSCVKLRRSLSRQGWSADDLEVIIVDDGSSDGTAEAAQDAVESCPWMRLIRLPWHAGKGAAVRLGVAAAHGDAIVFMDADLATDLASLPAGLKALRDADLVIGSRAAAGAVVTGRSRIRTLLNRVFGSNARRLTGVRVSDPQCGFKLFRSDAAKVLLAISRVDGFGFDVEILLIARKVGYRVMEMPVRWHAVRGSHVNILRDPLIMLRDLLRVRVRYGRRRALTRSTNEHSRPAAGARLTGGDQSGGAVS